jgi:hypothetical protein
MNIFEKAIVKSGKYTEELPSGQYKIKIEGNRIRLVKTLSPKKMVNSHIFISNDPIPSRYNQ